MFGGYNTEKVKIEELIDWYDCQPSDMGYWQLALWDFAAYSYNETTSNSSTHFIFTGSDKVVIDSGTSRLTFPEKYFSNLTNTIINSEAKNINITCYKRGSSGYCTSLQPISLTSFVTFKFGFFSMALNYQIVPAQYIYILDIHSPPYYAHLHSSLCLMN